MLTLKRPVEARTTQDNWLGPAPWIVVPPPGPRAALAINRDERVTSPSNTRPYPLVVKRARGSIVEDVDDNRYLDFMAGIAVCSTGHCHPQVVSAITEQAHQLLHICGSDFYYEPMIALCEKLVSITPGKHAKKVYLTNSGAEAIEAAIKLARHHTRRKGIIAFYGAFHGRTMGALSLTASKNRQQEQFGPLVPMVFHAPYGDVDFIRNHILTQSIAPREVAAIFVEPLQGEGGYIVPPPEFLGELRALCDEFGILLVADEVQSGMGRTGKMFCFEHAGILPDIIVTAKGIGSGMPIGAIIASEKIMDWPEGVQGSTYGGNPVCCASALATIDLLERQLIRNVTELAPFAMSKLESITTQFKCISSPRGLGFMLAVTVVKDSRKRDPDPAMRDRIVQEAFNRGLLLLGCGAAGIRFTPPLCMNRVQLQVGMDVFAEAVATVSE